MRYLKIIIMLGFMAFLNNANAQTTIIDFTKNPYTYAGNGTYDPNYWDNGGCGTYHRFGPNPLPVNGYNVRTVGGTLVSPVFTNTSTTYQLSMYAGRNQNDPQIMNNDPHNVVLSIEYPFNANKSYIIEINGINDHSWTSGSTPSNLYNGIFWVKLENNAEILTDAQNKCEQSLTYVKKSVGRYSKLIADPSKAIQDRTYTVKFSPLENKNALKITFDCSPIAPNIIIDNIFRLKNIKINEIPYEEESPYPDKSYNNIPSDFRTGDAFNNITVEDDLPKIYYNTSVNGNFTQTNCSLGTPDIVPFNIPAGVYTSLVSQADADQIAANALTTQGQNNANENGTCGGTRPTVVLTNLPTKRIDVSVIFSNLNYYKMELRNNQNGQISISYGTPGTYSLYVPTIGSYSVRVTAYSNSFPGGAISNYKDIYVSQ